MRNQPARCASTSCSRRREKDRFYPYLPTCLSLSLAIYLFIYPYLSILCEVRELEAKLLEAISEGAAGIFDQRCKAQAKVYFGLRSLLLSGLRASFLMWAQASSIHSDQSLWRQAQTRSRPCIHLTSSRHPATLAFAPRPEYRPHINRTRITSLALPHPE